MGSRTGLSKSTPASIASASPSWSLSTLVRTSSTRPGFEVAELERAEGHADQAVHLKAQMLEDALDLAVLALAQAHA